LTETTATLRTSLFRYEFLQFLGAKDNQIFQAIPFEAQFADENEEYKALATMTSTDGFAFSVDPLYKIIAGHEWYIQVLYQIEGSQGRSRRSVIQPGHQLARRAAISSSKNGTNIGILQIG
jgi:hypothetical protein